MASRRKIGIRLAALALGSVLFLGLVECGLRILDPSPRVRMGWNSQDILAAGIDSVNQLGFRGKKIRAKAGPREKIVLLLGDSQVEANALPFAYMLENLLETALNRADTAHTYVCYSLGSGGFGQDQQLLVLREYFTRYTADRVLLWFTPENDVWNNTFPTHWPANGLPKPTFWLTDGKLQGPQAAYHAYDTAPSSGLRLWDKLRGSADRDGEWEQRLPSAAEPKAFSGAAQVYEQAGADENFSNGKTHYSVWLTERTPRFQYGMDLTRALLEQIRTECEAHGAGFGIFSVDGMSVTQAPDTVFYVQKDERLYALSKKAYYGNIAYIMRGFPYRNLALAGDWTSVSRQDLRHFNHTAQQEIADSLAVWLTR